MSSLTEFRIRYVSINLRGDDCDDDCDDDESMMMMMVIIRFGHEKY